jgi:uncharacterized membrane protein
MLMRKNGKTGSRRRHLEACGLAATVGITVCLFAWTLRALLGLSWQGVALLLVPTLIVMAMGAAKGHHARWMGTSVPRELRSPQAAISDVGRLFGLSMALLLLIVLAVGRLWESTDFFGVLFGVCAMLVAAVLWKQLRNER